MGQWVRIYALAPSPNRRRQLLQNGTAVPASGPGGDAVGIAVEQSGAGGGAGGLLPLTPVLQRQVAVAAEYAASELAEEGVWASARGGTLDAYLYGDNLVDSGTSESAASGRCCTEQPGRREGAGCGASAQQQRQCAAVLHGSSCSSAEGQGLGARLARLPVCLHCAPCLPNPSQPAAHLPAHLLPASSAADAFEGADHIRFSFRVTAKGSNWIQLSRPLPYNLRTRWQVWPRGR